MIATLAIACCLGQASVIEVSNTRELREAATKAKPGTTVSLAPGDYEGGASISNLRGSKANPITIRAADPKSPPRFIGGGSGLQFSDIEHVVIDGLAFERARGNGLNIDDGGTIESPSRFVTVRNVTVKDLPSGNNDGIKLSGLDDFTIENCTVVRWGGSGIDMVGCHSGRIVRCTFLDGGSSGVQMKGGTSDISIQECRFERYGERGVNLGGSTGLQFFRPPLSSIAAGKRYEAQDLKVHGCTFIGGTSPIAFVGVDRAYVRYNTIIDPARWAIRILQETRSPDFLMCQKGVFEANLIAFRSDRWFSGGVNVGDMTDPASFAFRGNLWFCMDRPERSKPTLPTPDSNGVFGVDPLFVAPERGDYGVKNGSPAKDIGAHAYPGAIRSSSR